MPYQLDPRNQPTRLSLARRSAVAVLAVVACLASGYLTFASLSGDGSVAGCGGSALLDCDHVVSGRWARWLGLPVSLAGALVYAAIAAAALLAGPLRNWRAAPTTRLAAATLLPGLVALAAGAAVWFIFLQVAVIGKLCLFCLVAHACGLTIAALVFGRGPRRVAPVGKVHALRAALGVPGDTSRAAKSTSAPSRHRPWQAAAVGVAGVAILIAGQVLFPAPTYEVAEFPDVGETESAAGGDTQLEDPATTYADGDPEPVEVPEHFPPGLDPRKHVVGRPPIRRDGAAFIADRQISVLGGKARLDVADHLLLGSPTAPHIVVKMFDYTCPHCRTLHQQLEEARARYRGELTVLLLPVPMNSSCNRHVGVTHARHENACHYARLAHAVWRLDAVKFQQLHAWLFEPKVPPNVDEALAYAGNLVGPSALNRMLSGAAQDERDRRRLIQNTQLYASSGGGRIPKLLMGRYVMSGDPNDAGQLFSELEEKMGMHPPGF